MTVTREVVWQTRSQPQEALLACPVQDVFYGGARGGGKTDGLLGDFCAHAGKHGAQARGILFRRTYPELEQVEARAREVYGPLGWTYNETKKTWTAPNGATCKLRYLKRDADADNYQGHSYTWQGWDELGNWSTPAALDKLLATLRSPHGVPCVRRSTGNPGGPGHGWVKRRYIDPHPEGYRPFTWAPNPNEPHLTVTSVFIPSTLDDNPLIAASGYEALIAAATAGNEALYQAWRYGRWDVFVGQAYHEFRRDVHVIRGKGPDAFPRWTEWFATMDWGYTRGTYGLHAVDTEGRVELVWEFYDAFTQLHAKEAAVAIAEAQRRAGWPAPQMIHGDVQMFQRIGTGMTLAEEFMAGLRVAYGPAHPPLLEAKHPPGSRAVKVALIHASLAYDDTKRDAQGRLEPWALPHYRVHERCTNTIRVLQEIPVDPDRPDDVDPDYADDHPHDMVGFAVACRPPRATAPKAAKHEDQADRPRWRQAPEPEKARPVRPSVRPPWIGTRGQTRTVTD